MDIYPNSVSFDKKYSLNIIMYKLHRNENDNKEVFAIIIWFSVIVSIENTITSVFSIYLVAHLRAKEENWL